MTTPSAATTPTLVIGNGELGIEIVHSLAFHPQRASNPVAVLLRQATIDSTDHKKRFRHQAMRWHDITFVAGDIDKDSAASLAATFTQFHTIIGASGMIQASGTQLKLTQAIIAASKTPGSKVQRYIPWQFGLDYDVIGRGSAQGLFTEQLDVRDALRASQDSLSWVIVSTGIFTTFLFLSAFDVVNGLAAFDHKLQAEPLPEAWNRPDLSKIESSSPQLGHHLAEYQSALAQLEQHNVARLSEDRAQQLRDAEQGQLPLVRALGSWDRTVTYTTPRDIGRLTAEIVFAAPEVRNEVVFVAGDTASFAQVKQAVEDALGREVKGELWDLEYLRESLRTDPDNGMKKYQVILAEGVGVAWDKAKTFNAQRGITTQTIEAYAAARFHV